MQYWEHVQLAALVGSHGYGLANEDSDYDWRGFYAPPTRNLLGIHSPPEQLEKKWDNQGKGNDETYWEVKKYLLLLLSNNPNALESLWVDTIKMPVKETTDLVQELIDMRGLFLSKRLIRTYGGYATSQWKRGMESLDKDKPSALKNLMHLCRLLISASSTLRTGKLMVNAGEYREQLLRIRNNEMSIPEIAKWQAKLEDEFQKAKEQTSLPDNPDEQAADDWLLRFRLKLLS